jgi:signal transduction histidine kinase
VFVRFLDGRRVWGQGAQPAARQASLLFALAGLVTVPGILTLPGGAELLVIIGAVDGCVALLAWWLPWQRWGRLAPLVLSLPALAVISGATWAMGAFASGTAPFFVLLFVWLGLNFPARAVLAVAVPAVVAYVVPLLVAQRPRVVVGSVFIMVPVLVGVGLLIAFQVAHQQRLTAWLREANAELQRVTRWRATLVSTVAHDVRAPLASVQFALDAMADADGEQWEKLLSAARAQTGRVRRLATGLLDLERVETVGVLRLDRREVCLADHVHQALTYLGAAAADVHVDIDPGLTVSADPERLEQILLNLVSNALAHAGPPVCVSADRHTDSVHLEVRDHGPGVPSHLVPRLFTRFSDGDTNPESVGLGLWISRELARAHGGDIQYRPGDAGACFVVSLPLDPSLTSGRSLSTDVHPSAP